MNWLGSFLVSVILLWISFFLYGFYKNIRNVEDEGKQKEVDEYEIFRSLGNDEWYEFMKKEDCI
jgi:hypothetical protein